MTLNQKFITAVKEWKESAIFLLIKLSGAVSCLYFNKANLWGSMERQGGMSSVQPCRVEQLCNSEQHDLTFEHIVGCSGRTVLSMFSHNDYAEEANRGNMARYLIKNKSLTCPSCTKSTQTHPQVISNTPAKFDEWFLCSVSDRQTYRDSCFYRGLLLTGSYFTEAKTKML